MNRSFESWQLLLKEKARPYLLQGRQGDWDHTLRVVEYGKTLLNEEKGDPEIVLTALILHDIGWSQVSFDDFVKAPPEKKKETSSLKDHMLHSAALAREILEPTHFPEDRKERVISIITHHDQPETIFAMPEPEPTLVMEADRLDRFGPESLRRYRKMFGEQYLMEGRSFLKEGAKIWFRTPTARRLVQEMLAKVEKSPPAHRIN